ncbi:MAG: hypothetical protein ACT4QF_19630 [Sporichthyaceae bacterium]
MRIPTLTGVLIASAAGLVCALPGAASAHIGPANSLTDTDPAAAGIQLATGTNLVLCANHAASTLFLTPDGAPGTYYSASFASGQCRSFANLPVGTYKVGGFTAKPGPAQPCVNANNNPNYPDCPRPFEYVKVFAPNNQAEITWLEPSATVHVSTAPATPTYGIPNNANLNYPHQGTNNVPVVVVSFQGNPDTI